MPKIQEFSWQENQATKHWVPQLISGMQLKKTFRQTFFFRLSSFF